MMNGFTFQNEYYIVIKRLKKQQDREALMLAIAEFMFEDKQPKNLSIVISSLLLNQPFDVAHIANIPLKNVKIFTVYTKAFAKSNNIIINCGKTRCIDCRRCYKKNKTPVYIAEILK
jgi:hypothetical protein